MGACSRCVRVRAGVSSLSRVRLLTPPQHYKYGLPRPFEFLRTTFYHPHSLLPPLSFNMRASNDNIIHLSITHEERDIICDDLVPQFARVNAAVQVTVTELFSRQSYQVKKRVVGSFTEGLVR